MIKTHQGACQKMLIGLHGTDNSGLTNDASFNELQQLIGNHYQPSNKGSLATKEMLNFNIDYTLLLGNDEIAISDFLDKSIHIQWQQQITCKKCLKPSKKSYGQGYCYLCFKRSASCDICMMQPHTCHHHLGTCREPNWAEQVCFDDHIVYLTYTSGIKVGITRLSQVPTRWLDQGAVFALPIIKTSSRRLAGIIEACISQHFADKTNWRTMLKTAFIKLNTQNAELVWQSAKHIKETLADEIEQSIAISPIFKEDNPTQNTMADSYQWINDYPMLAFNYPVVADMVQSSNTPLKNIKISSHNLDKTPNISGKLLAIKGQYLLLDTGVINMRKYTSYQIAISV